MNPLPRTATLLWPLLFDCYGWSKRAIPLYLQCHTRNGHKRECCEKQCVFSSVENKLWPCTQSMWKQGVTGLWGGNRPNSLETGWPMILPCKTAQSSTKWWSGENRDEDWDCMKWHQALKWRRLLEAVRSLAKQWDCMNWWSGMEIWRVEDCVNWYSEDCFKRWWLRQWGLHEVVNIVWSGEHCMKQWT